MASTMDASVRALIRSRNDTYNERIVYHYLWFFPRPAVTTLQEYKNLINMHVINKF